LVVLVDLENDGLTGLGRLSCEARRLSMRDEEQRDYIPINLDVKAKARLIRQ